MSPDAFSDLCESYRAVRYYPFSQRLFRQRYLPTVRWGLCSTLVAHWLRGDFAPGQRVPAHTTERLATEMAADLPNHLYLELPPNSALPGLGTDEREWLKRKYGIDRLEDLPGLMASKQATDLRDLDIALSYPDSHIERLWFPSYTSGIWTTIGSKTGRGTTVILVLGGKEGQSPDHRMAMKWDQDAYPTFFDPNGGEVAFGDWQALASWLHVYWFLRRYDGRSQPRPLLAYLVGDRTSGPGE